MHDDYISHYGVKRRSGRYPWGSGDEPFQRGSENTINGVARNLNDRDLKSASKSLGISNKNMSEAKSNSDYIISKNVIFGGNLVNTTYGPLPSGPFKPSAFGGNQVNTPDEEIPNRPSDDHEVPDMPEDNTIIGRDKKKGWLGKLQSALDKMSGFFKRKISEIIDKFDD